MEQKTSEHIDCLMAFEEAVRKQFEISELEILTQPGADSDPLKEKEHEVASGMINKYGNRVLCLMTADCAAYCRFCTRRRLVGPQPRHLSCSGPSGEAEAIRERLLVDGWVRYLQAHPKVREVILSGGDPFIVEDEIFEYALCEISSLDTIRVIRIGTRSPVSEPSLVNAAKLEAIERVEQPVYVGIHFEHPSEITRAAVRCVKDLRSAGAILYSQSVFLKGVNDDYETLHELFSRLIEIGVRPYYIYRCDPVPGAMHFIVDLEKERRIMTELRRNLSGLACPVYVIDAPDGSGKIPVPLEFWDADVSSYTDFEGKRHTG